MVTVRDLSGPLIWCLKKLRNHGKILYLGREKKGQAFFRRFYFCALRGVKKPETKDAELDWRSESVLVVWT